MSKLAGKPRRRMTPDARRAQIIDSARAVWSRSGAHGTTVKHIASEAGITEHFVYRHFSSREEIFHLAVLRPLTEALNRLLARLPQAGGDAAGVMLRLHDAFLLELPGMVPLMSAAQFADPDEGPRLFNEKLLPALQARLAGAIGQWMPPSDNALAMELVVRALLGAYFGVALESILTDEPVELDELRAELAALLVQDFSGLQHCGPLFAQYEVSQQMNQNRAASEVVVELPHGGQKLSREQREQVILEAARHEFLFNGLRGAKTKLLAERAGITEAYLLRIFGSKRELYEAAIIKPLAEGLASLSQRIRELAQVDELDLMRYLNLSLPFFAEYGPLFVSALFAELDEARDYYREWFQPHLDQIEASLKVLLPPAGVSARTARRATAGACWALSFSAPPQSEAQAACVLAWLFGLVLTGPKTQD